MASTDPLTGLANRRGLSTALEALAPRVECEDPLSVLAIDVDYFKSFNDTLGHAAGDNVLQVVAAILRSSVRDHDLVARTGGEEFIIVLPGTGVEAATQVAEALRQAGGTHNWVTRAITCSVGVATAQSKWKLTAVAKLIEDADRALYHSKRTGRDRVTHSYYLEDSAGVLVGSQARPHATSTYAGGLTSPSLP